MTVNWVSVGPLAAAQEVLYLCTPPSSPFAVTSNHIGGLPGCEPPSTWVSLPQPSTASTTVWNGTDYAISKTFPATTITRVQLQITDVDGAPVALASGELALSITVYSE